MSGPAFDDRACLEVAHIVGVLNYLTRLADGSGLQLDGGTREAADSGVALKRAAASPAPKARLKPGLRFRARDGS